MDRWLACAFIAACTTAKPPELALPVPLARPVAPAPPAQPAPPPSASAIASAEPADPCASVPADMACIPAGELIRGIDRDPHRCAQGGQPPTGTSAATPAARIQIDAFFLERTEVTVAAYRHCVEHVGCREAHPFYGDFDAPDQPMTGVTWYEAHDYCEKIGRRLPTEAEWEKAARGPDGEATPFGNVALDCTLAVVEDARGRSCGEKNRQSEPDVGRVLPVGSRPVGRYGLFDMAGNAEEWVADWWSESYAACGEGCAGPNPTGPCGSAEPCAGHTFRAVRGGSWYWEGVHATGYHRRRHVPNNAPPHHFGFRCALDAR